MTIARAAMLFASLFCGLIVMLVGGATLAAYATEAPVLVRFVHFGRTATPFSVLGGFTSLLAGFSLVSLAIAQLNGWGAAVMVKFWRWLLGR